MLAPQQAVAPRTSSRIHRGGDGEDMGFDAEFHYLILVFGTMAPIAVPPLGQPCYHEREHRYFTQVPVGFDHNSASLQVCYRSETMTTTEQAVREESIRAIVSFFESGVERCSSTRSFTPTAAPYRTASRTACAGFSRI